MQRNDSDRYKVFTRRAALFGLGQAALVGGLAARLYYLQVIESDQYKVLADENRINLRLLAPPRGRVLDRFGVEIATNRQNYRVLIIREQTDSVERTLNRLGELIRIEDWQRQRVLREVERKRKFVPVAVADNLTWEEFARINLHSPDLPGVQLDVGETRDYPLHEITAHAVGYVAAVSEADLKEHGDDPLLELPGFRIGKNGLERVYDLHLRGRAGDSRVEVNAYGRVIRELARRDGQAGNDLVLTLDAELQRFAFERLGELSAAAVVMDIHTGDLLTLVSTPSFDPNAFNVGVSRDYWRSLIGNKMKPLTNKAAAAEYPPGSTYKMLVALAGLEHGVITPDQRVFCPGHMVFGNNTFHCWKRGGHGNLAMVSAIEESCDVYFYEVSRRLHVDRLADMAHRFGLGKATPLGLPGERNGLVPTAAWKRAVRGEPWHLGENLSIGIGQGYMLATPLQLCVMAARLANGGFAVEPRLVRPGGDLEDGDDLRTAAERGVPSLKVSPASLKVVLDGMKGVTLSQRGTAYASRIKEPGMAMAGKTGTSQVRRITKRDREEGLHRRKDIPWEERDHALFVAYAPVEEPRYACAVVVEHGESGSKAAAPLARDILIECQRLDPSRRPGRARFAQSGDGGRGT
ncbi:MAG: penicillin-binding protein 2 [Alphaproteobacteria bacterium]|nr:penicillin-binding protein 2 [Alphaproteobacteria bacterium]